METRIVKEKPLYEYIGCCPQFGQSIRLYKKDLEKAEIGTEWHCENQNRYPNRDDSWYVNVEVVYRTEKNVYLHCYCTTTRYSNYDELVAIELA